jgi:flagellar biosynthesis/type III secretory pathway chaperone
MVSDPILRDVKEIHEELNMFMKREATVMRELLDSVHYEQQVLLLNETETLKELHISRDDVMKCLLNVRQKRIEAVDELKAHPSNCQNTDQSDLLELLSNDNSLTCEIISYRDQMLALYEQISLQTERNNYLIKNKISMTKEMLDRLHPTPAHPTYNNSGVIKTKEQQVKVALINQEG